MMQAMYTRFATEQRTTPFTPPPFSMLKYQKEIDRLERAYNEHFNTLWNMLSKAKFSLTRGFFETVASRVKHVYDIANRDVEIWLRSVMSPLESHVREHHLQLQRRLESVKRIHVASGELETRIAELEQQHEAIAAQIAALMRHVESIDRLVAAPRRAARSPRTPRRALRVRRASGARFAAIRPSYFASSTTRALDVIGIDRDAVDRADLDTLRRVEVADALGAFRGIDDVDLRPLRDRVVRALGLADVAVDAFVGDHQRHRVDPISSGCRDLGLQPREHRGMHEGRHVAAELRDLAHDRRRNERVLLRRRQEQRFDLGKEIPVHPRHLEFVLEIGHGAKPAQDHARTAARGRSPSAAPKTASLRRWRSVASTSRAMSTRSAVVKYGCFDALSATPTIDVVEELRRAADEVLVAAGERDRTYRDRRR